eukprot:8971537-Prorocentrum_lima.AAC.1
MTSSLVGSEMCIRDRCKSCAPTGDTSLAVALQSRSATRTSYPDGRRPVSYTHLTLPTICSV